MVYFIVLAQYYRNSETDSLWSPKIEKMYLFILNTSEQRKV